MVLQLEYLNDLKRYNMSLANQLLSSCNIKKKSDKNRFWAHKNPLMWQLGKSTQVSSRAIFSIVLARWPPVHQNYCPFLIPASRKIAKSCRSKQTYCYNHLPKQPSSSISHLPSHPSLWTNATLVLTCKAYCKLPSKPPNGYVSCSINIS